MHELLVIILYLLFSLDSMLLVLIRAGYVVECRKIALTRDFSTLRSSGLSSFGVGC